MSSNKPSKVLGKAVYLKVPPLPGSSIEIPDDAKEEVFKKYIEKLSVLEVYDVGKDCTSGIRKGQKVFINPLAAQSMIHIEIDDEPIGVISEINILHIVQ